MKKRSRRGEALLQRVLGNKDVLEYAKEKRIASGIPESGLEQLGSAEAIMDWLYAYGRRPDLAAAQKPFEDFFAYVDLNARISFEGVISNEDFRMALWELFAFGSITMDISGLGADSLLYESFLVFDGIKHEQSRGFDRMDNSRNSFVDGVYIRISPTASAEEIGEYVAKNGDNIKKLQTNFRDRKGLVKEYLKLRPNFDRDLIVEQFMSQKSNDLRKISGIKGSARKEDHVSEILFNRNVANLSPAAIKKAYYRGRKSKPESNPPVLKKFRRDS